MKTKTKIRDLLLMTIIAIPVGALIGAIASYFGQVLLMITAFRDSHPLHLIPFLAIGGMIVVWCYEKFGGDSKKGMTLLIEAGSGKAEIVPLRLVPMIIVATWITHLFGGSAGREGVAVQIGGAISYNIGIKLKLNEAPKVFLIVGMASGFAGLFQTPLAGVIFALEVVAIDKMRYYSILPAIAGALTSCYTSKLLGLEKFFVNIDATYDIKKFSKIALCAVAFGLIGGAFAFLLKNAKKLTAKIKNPILRIGIIGAVVSLLLLVLWNGRYAGLGTNLIANAFNSKEIMPYDFALKFALTIITLSAGYQGGEVTPLFSIGASLGVVLAGLLGLPVELVAAVGYATVFGSATNTLFAPMLIGLEVFGAQAMPYIIIASVIAYLVNFNQSIYAKKGL